MLGRNEMTTKSISIADKTIWVYPSPVPSRPVVYLNMVAGDGSRIYHRLRDMKCPDFTLAVISGLHWDHDMSPWAIPPISDKDTPCTGGADEYLQILTDEIIPRVEAQIPGGISWRGIAGYSLAGLFALYAMYRTPLFSRAASVSGSLWFPGLKEYIFTHEMQRKPEHLYVSLGDREHRTSNPFLQVVQQNTKEITEYYQSQGTNTVFELNPGGHFKQADERTAAGIAWLLER